MELREIGTNSQTLTLPVRISPKGIEKNLPSLRVGWPTPAPPTLPVMMVILLHTQPFAERFP